MMTSAKKCEFCDKRGLPLLLVRDAVAPSKSGAPVAPSVAIELASSAAHYTKRLLRSGYVNVFDEARKRWETYFVTSDNYFFKLLQTPGACAAPPTKPFNCPDEGHRAIASCITVPDPVNATKVWIGFSDVEWTDAVRKENENAAYRKRHMTEIDVKAVLKGSQLLHPSIKQVEAVVAEFAMSSSQPKATFGWSPFRFSSRHGQADRLEKECESLRPSSAIIVTLPDPCGIAQELAFLMKRNADLFFENNAENKKNLAAGAAIDSIEEAIRQHAEDQETAAAKHIADQQIEANPIGHWLSEPARAKTEALRTVNPAELKRAADSAWKRYEAKFDEKARQRWYAQLNARLKAFDEEFIAPLARNHVSWMTSDALANYFECNYDPNHTESGLVYTSALTQCLIATQDKTACADLYGKWLSGGIADRSNLLLRAMIINLKINEESIKSAANVSIDWRQIPWDNIFAAHSKAVERLSEAANDVTARLIVQIGGPLARMFNKIMDGSSGFRAAVMATGLISGHPVVFCDIVGTKRQFRLYLIRQLLQASGQVISENQMRRAVNAELIRQGIHGVSIEGNERKRWIMIADKEVIRRMPSGLSPQARAKELAKSLKTLEELEALNMNRWRTVINGNLGPGIVTAIVQAICLTKLMSDEEKSLKHDRSDAVGRRYSGMAAVAATTSETIGKALLGQASPGLRLGQGIASNLGTILQRAGVGGALGAGLVVAVLDGFKAYEAKHEKQFGLAWLYSGSVGVGLGLTAALIYATSMGALAVPVIGLLIVLLIGIGLIIDRIKDNPIQDWLERCPWGISRSQRYADFDTQQSQLMQALKG